MFHAESCTGLGKLFLCATSANDGVERETSCALDRWGQGKGYTCPRLTWLLYLVLHHSEEVLPAWSQFPHLGNSDNINLQFQHAAARFRSGSGGVSWLHPLFVHEKRGLSLPWAHTMAQPHGWSLQKGSLWYCNVKGLTLSLPER